MNMKEIVEAVLAQDATALMSWRKEMWGKTAGQVFAESLAEEAIGGDIKAASLLLELAGEDVRRREYAYKHGAEEEKETEKAPVIVDVRPE